MVYMDDILIYLRTLKEHKEYIKWIIVTLSKAEMRI